MLNDNQLAYSPIEAECIGLDFAATCCIELYSDCSGMLDMLKKPLCDIQNKRHIPATSNKIADALSRLCGIIAKTNHTPCDNLRLLPMSKKAEIYRKQLETEDPLVMRLAVQAGLDLEYVEMVNLVENRTEYKAMLSSVMVTDS